MPLYAMHYILFFKKNTYIPVYEYAVYLILRLFPSYCIKLLEEKREEGGERERGVEISF